MPSDAVAVELIGKIDKLHEDHEEIVRYARRSRTLIRWLVGSLVLDVLLTVGVGVTTYLADQAATRSHHAISVACKQANDVRRLEHDLWASLFALPPQPGQKPPPPERLADLHAKVDAFRPVDCTKLR